MPIDPSISLAVKPPQIDSPIKTMEGLYSLQNQQEELKGRKLLNADRDLDNQKKTREAADDAAIRQELANAKATDTGELDVPGAIARLHKGGHGTAGLKLTKQWGDHLREQAQTSKSEIERHQADLEMGARLWAGVKDDATLAAAKRAAPAVMGPDSTKMMEGLPDSYAAAKAQIDSLLEAGNKMADKLKAAHESVTERQYALEHGLVDPDPAKGERVSPDVLEKREKANALMTSSVGKMLSQTDNDTEYQQQLKAFKSQGYPVDILNKFDTVWSKRAVERAKALTMTPEEIEKLRIENKNADTSARNAETSAAREKRESETGPKVDPLHSNDMQEYNAARQEYDKNNPTSTKAVTLVDDPANPGKLKAVPTPKRKEFDSFEAWRLKVKKRDASGKLVAGTPAPEPVQGASVAPTPPPQSPSLGSNVKPTAPAAAATPPRASVPQATVPPPVGGVRVQLPPDPKDPAHPNGRIVKFKTKADADAFAKAAGYTFKK